MGGVISVRRRLAIGAAATVLLSGLVGLGAQPAHAAAALNLFVNDAGGSDSNTCLSVGAACKTIQAALNKGADGIEQDVVVNVADGDYDPGVNPVTIPGTGSGNGNENSIVILGQGTAATKLRTSNSAVSVGVKIDAPIWVRLEALTITGSSSNAAGSGNMMGVYDSAVAGASGAVLTLNNMAIDTLQPQATASSIGGQVVGVESSDGSGGGVPLRIVNSTISNLTGGAGSNLGGGVNGVITNGPLTVIGSIIDTLTSAENGQGKAPAIGILMTGAKAEATVTGTRIAAIHAAQGLGGGGIPYSAPNGIGILNIGGALTLASSVITDIKGGPGRSLLEGSGGNAYGVLGFTDSQVAIRDSVVRTVVGGDGAASPATPTPGGSAYGVLLPPTVASGPPSTVTRSEISGISGGTGGSSPVAIPAATGGNAAGVAGTTPTANDGTVGEIVNTTVAAVHGGGGGNNTTNQSQGGGGGAAFGIAADTGVIMHVVHATVLDVAGGPGGTSVDASQNGAPGPGGYLATSTNSPGGQLDFAASLLETPAVSSNHDCLSFLPPNAAQPIAGFTDNGYNVVGDASCNPLAATSSSTGVGPLTLANNDATLPSITGGPARTAAITDTFEKVPLSSGFCSGGLSQDQRGEARPGFATHDKCDAGAYELQGTDTERNYHLRVDVVGDGTVTDAAGAINCPTDLTKCDANYSGSLHDVSLTAMASSGWRFAGWDGCPEIVADTDDCGVPMDAAHAVTAFFEPVTAAPGDGGGGNPGGTEHRAPAHRHRVNPNDPCGAITDRPQC